MNSTSTEAAAARTVVITGGNTGLGYACASEILRSPEGPPWRVVIACRDATRAQAAADSLTALDGAHGQVQAMSLDLASLASVRTFAATLKRRLEAGTLPPLHGLVCNAGVQSGTAQTATADGFESTFGVNHLGHFLLVTELTHALQAPGRVVVVASGVHDPKQKAGLPAPAWNYTLSLSHGSLGPAADKDKPFAAGQRRYSTSNSPTSTSPTPLRATCRPV